MQDVLTGRPLPLRADIIDVGLEQVSVGIKMDVGAYDVQITFGVTYPGKQTFILGLGPNVASRLMAAMINAGIRPVED